MNEQQTKLIEQLAMKLGTTTEYLWGVMCKQAQVDAILSIVLVSSAIVLSIVVGLVANKLRKELDKEAKWTDNIEDFLIMSMLWTIIACVVFDFIVMFSIGNIIIALSNPEYWALQELIGMLK